MNHGLDASLMSTLFSPSLLSVIPQADVVKALQLNVRQLVRRLVEEAQMEVRAPSDRSSV